MRFNFLLLTHGHGVQRIPDQSHVARGPEVLRRRPVSHIEILDLRVGRDDMGQRPERFGPSVGELSQQLDAALIRLREIDGRRLVEETVPDGP